MKFSPFFKEFVFRALDAEQVKINGKMNVTPFWTGLFSLWFFYFTVLLNIIAHGFEVWVSIQYFWAPNEDYQNSYAKCKTIYKACVRKNIADHDIVAQIVKHNHIRSRGGPILKRTVRFICLTCKYHKFVCFEKHNLLRHLGDRPASKFKA